MQNFKLSILDQGPVSEGMSPTQALQNMRDSVVLADQLGYHRFWFAEHHNAETFASSAPELAIAHLSALTRRIRLGSGGIMMMHYSPYKMAETFKTLSAFAPGRIDFGAGRAPGGDGKSILALSEGRDTRYQDLFAKFSETLKLMRDQDGDQPFHKNIIAQPYGVTLPEGFMLGSTGNSALEAARMGVSYAYVQFFTGTIDPDIFRMYHLNFIPSAFQDKPNALACYFVTVAETDEEAEFQALSSDIARLHLHTGRRIVRMSPEEAARYPLSPAEQMFIEQNKSWNIRGSASKVAQILREEQSKNGFDELMICTIPYSHEYKMQEYRLLAREFGLSSQ